MSAIKEHHPRGQLPPGQDGGGPRGPRADSPPVVTAPPGAPALPVAETPPLIESPSDGFAYELPVADTGLRGETPTFKRPVSELTPDLRQIREQPDVSNRFAADYQLVARELVDVPDADSSEKAQRTFEYFTKYAERFVELGEKPKSDQLSAKELALIASLPEDQLPPELQEKLRRMREKEGPPQLPLPQAETPEGKGKSRLERLQQPEGRDLWGLREAKRQEEAAGPNKQGGSSLSEGDKKTSAQAFVETLSHLSFDQLRDERTGQTGLERAHELLMSRSLKELQQKAEQTKMTASQWPPPSQQPKSEELVREQPRKQAANEFTGAPLTYKEIGESPMKLSHRQAQDPLKDGVELRVNTLAAEVGKGIIVPRDPRELHNHAPGNEADPRRRTKGKLGNNMLWNVLHKFRGEGEDSTLEQAKWDRMTFGAMLFLVLVTLMVVALVSM